MRAHRHAPWERSRSNSRWPGRASGRPGHLFRASSQVASGFGIARELLRAHTPPHIVHLVLRTRIRRAEWDDPMGSRVCAGVYRASEPRDDPSPAERRRPCRRRPRLPPERGCFKRPAGRPTAQSSIASSLLPDLRAFPLGTLPSSAPGRHTSHSPLPRTPANPGGLRVGPVSA